MRNIIDDEERPNEAEAHALAEAIRRAWAKLKVPGVEAISIDTSELHETRRIEKYFIGRHFLEVDVGARKVSEEMPLLIGFTAVGLRYYVSAFLLHVLDIGKHPAGCMDSPSVDLVGYLADENRWRVAEYSRDELECIRRVVIWMLHHNRFCFLDEEKQEKLRKTADDLASR